MDKKILDLQINLAKIDKKEKFFNSDIEEINLRMLSYAEVIKYLDVFYLLHAKELIHIKSIRID